jgi:hypothetical protein
MAKVQMFDNRPACRICGTKSHVTKVANPRSPHLGCCAWCGGTAAELNKWLKAHSHGELQRMLDVLLQIRLEEERHLEAQATHG